MVMRRSKLEGMHVHVSSLCDTEYVYTYMHIHTRIHIYSYSCILQYVIQAFAILMRYTDVVVLIAVLLSLNGPIFTVC
jgi:hypothetical protein